MSEMRLNVRIEGAMSAHVESVIASGLYSNQSEYVRDLIRHDISEPKSNLDYPSIHVLKQEIIDSYSSLAAGDFSDKTTDEVFAQAQAEFESENGQVIN